MDYHKKGGWGLESVVDWIFKMWPMLSKTEADEHEPAEVEFKRTK